jgi:hypothetical protein
MNMIFHGLSRLLSPAVLLVTVTGCAPAAQRATLATGERLDFPTRGFRLEGITANGWQRTQLDTGKLVVQWMSTDSSPTDLRALVKVEAAKPTFVTAEATAAGLAKDWSGEISPEKVDLDGVRAFQVVAKNETRTLKPVVGIVAMHEGFVYLVMGGVTSGHECQSLVDEIVRAWKWETIVAPSDHLDCWPQPISALGDSVVINYPIDMHLYATEHPDRILDLGLHDIRANKPSFLAYVQLVPIPQGSTVRNMKDDFAKRLTEQKMSDAVLEWSERGDEPARFVTGVSRSSAASKAAMQETYLKWALIPVGKEHLVLINFTIVAADPKERVKYDAAANAIVDSIQSRVAMGRAGR